MDARTQGFPVELCPEHHTASPGLSSYHHHLDRASVALLQNRARWTTLSKPRASMTLLPAHKLSFLRPLLVDTESKTYIS